MLSADTADCLSGSKYEVIAYFLKHRYVNNLRMEMHHSNFSALFHCRWQRVADRSNILRRNRLGILGPLFTSPTCVRCRGHLQLRPRGRMPEATRLTPKAPTQPVFVLRDNKVKKDKTRIKFSSISAHSKCQNWCPNCGVRCWCHRTVTRCARFL